MKKLVTIVAISLTLAGCSATQTTSGQEYLAQYSSVPVSAPRQTVRPDGTKVEVKSIDALVREAAAVEPILKFPARIGIARITDGSLTTIPPEEMTSWEALCNKLGRSFGECVPVSPMVARMVASGARDMGDSLNGVIDTIRLGAARQHLDAVLVYEVLSRESSHKNILAVANLSVIGGYVLPGRTHDAVGLGSALLIDVVQAYPYGTLSTTVEKKSRVSSSWGWGSDRKSDELAATIKAQAAKQLADEAYIMFQKLPNELDWAREDRADRLAAEKAPRSKKR